MIHFGKVNYTLGFSDPYDSFSPNTPSLIFNNFTPNSSVHFVFVYLYNEYLNATASNTPVRTSLLTEGLVELKTTLPSPIYLLVKEYTTEKWIAGSFFSPSAYEGKPPHINTVLIITGPNGTYMVNGYLFSPMLIQGYSPQYLLVNGLRIPQINSSYEELTEIVQSEIYSK
ncbi:hypothetical protein HS7_12040 [Sulfolobales archaeon HS-7]|nr:hypothetical protein HS7_12040 [Sulfolobales archaeon HS-7]